MHKHRKLIAEDKDSATTLLSPCKWSPSRFSSDLAQQNYADERGTSGTDWAKNLKLLMPFIIRLVTLSVEGLER
jgi:hypothetical protein